MGWFEPSGQPANPAEILFHTLLLLTSGTSVKDVEGWAASALAQLSGSAEGLPATAEWRMAGSKAGAMLAPLHLAYVGSTWSDARLTAIGAAMQAWRGCGRVNGLDAGRLMSHRAAKLTGADPGVAAGTAFSGGGSTDDSRP